jgi:hypothetical protein
MKTKGKIIKNVTYKNLIIKPLVLWSVQNNVYPEKTMHKMSLGIGKTQARGSSRCCHSSASKNALYCVTLPRVEWPASLDSPGHRTVL